jgi:hypothetical protein
MPLTVFAPRTVATALFWTWYAAPPQVNCLDRFWQPFNDIAGLQVVLAVRTVNASSVAVSVIEALLWLELAAGRNPTVEGGVIAVHKLAPH